MIHNNEQFVIISQSPKQQMRVNISSTIFRKKYGLCLGKHSKAQPLLFSTLQFTQRSLILQFFLSLILPPKFNKIKKGQSGQSKLV